MRSWPVNAIPSSWLNCVTSECTRARPNRCKRLLVGDYRAEHLFVLNQSLQAYRFYQARIQECNREIEPLLEKLALQVEAASAKLELGALQPASANDGAMAP